MTELVSSNLAIENNTPKQTEVMNHPRYVRRNPLKNYYKVFIKVQWGPEVWDHYKKDLIIIIIIISFFFRIAHL